MKTNHQSRINIQNAPNDLAIFGGTPAFDNQLYVGTPNPVNRERLFRRIDEVLDRNWLSNFGPCNFELSKALCRETGVRHAIPVASCTTGLEIAIRALGLNGEVIVPAFTFIATVHALWAQGISPVFCDVDPQTHCIDPQSVRRAISPRTTGILGVHLWGQPCDVERIAEIAKEHDLKVLYDAAHAYGTTYAGISIGNFGDAEVFSFHATKMVTSLEGGAVLTNSDELARRIFLMSKFGFSGYDRVECVGTNGKLNEVAAAFGLTSLEDVSENIEVHRRNYVAYKLQLEAIPGIRVYQHSPAWRPNYRYLVIEIDQSQLGLSRDQLLTVLHAENVIARRYFYPGCHRMEPYRSLVEPDAWELPITEQLTQKVLCLPTGSQVDAQTIESICGIIRRAATAADRITAAVGDVITQRLPVFEQDVF